MNSRTPFKNFQPVSCFNRLKKIIFSWFFLKNQVATLKKVKNLQRYFFPLTIFNFWQGNYLLITSNSTLGDSTLFTLYLVHFQSKKGYAISTNTLLYLIYFLAILYTYHSYSCLFGFYLNLWLVHSRIMTPLRFS